MLRRLRVFQFIAYSCVIAPVAFYAGSRLRGTRSSSSEGSLHVEEVPATLQPQEGVEWYVPMGQLSEAKRDLSSCGASQHRLREEADILEGKRRVIERKIAELQARSNN
ncbi:hypothetical protein JB92DRAFT_2952881, partial [Gautieria morchelliformis]